MRFGFRLLGIPIFCLALAFLLNSGADRFAASTMLSGIAPQLNYAGLASIVASVLCLAYNAWRVWQAQRGVGELCYSCGMPTSYHPNGRYGPYFKCWNCGTNRADR